MKKNILLQCVLCSFLLLASIVLSYRTNKRTAQVGAFGISASANDTFEDLSLNLFEEIFNE
ncbi:MAG: hypothetical protein IJW06_05795 [Clostridia bacterium]|nr:hypothetical protein [Clostridia bacterium]